MAGALYIWLVGACFLFAALIAGTLITLLWLGDRYDRRYLGKKGGFLEHVPDDLPIPPEPPINPPAKNETGNP